MLEILAHWATNHPKFKGDAFMKRLTTAAIALLAAACASSEPESSVQQAEAPAAPAAAAPTETASAATDYSDMANWLCRPGKLDDSCKVDISATVINADGSTALEEFAHDPDAPIDCFYVYPTVSLDPYMFSDLVPGPEEHSVVRTQLARFGSKCRLFAPMYRQFSLGALRAARGGAESVPQRGSREDGVADVDGAWNWYLENENNGRGVVILGHSQGSGQIMRLIADHVDGKAIQDKLVSAIVLGSSVQVPKGEDVGGTFKHIPVCHSADQFGCVLSYSTFRETVPPAEASGFGRGRPGNEAVCTNPAALDGGEAMEPNAYLSTAGIDWLEGTEITTPYVKVPGLISTQCVKTPTHHYLEVRIHADPEDPRADDHGGDVMANGAPDPVWGLHLIDANVGIGDLANVIEKQGQAWAAAHQ